MGENGIHPRWVKMQFSPTKWVKRNSYAMKEIQMHFHLRARYSLRGVLVVKRQLLQNPRFDSRGISSLNLGIKGE